MHSVNGFQRSHHDLEFADLPIPYLDDIHAVALNIIDDAGELEHSAAAINHLTHVAKVTIDYLTRRAQIKVRNISASLRRVYNWGPKMQSSANSSNNPSWEELDIMSFHRSMTSLVT